MYKQELAKRLDVVPISSKDDTRLTKVSSSMRVTVLSFYRNAFIAKEYHSGANL